MSGNMIVSIGVPIYGVERYIERCVRCLMEQTYDEIEVVFVDDCSPDKSMEILSRVLLDYQSRLNRVKVVTHPRNLGLGAARNSALLHMTGDFVMWLDSDDYMSLDAVQKVVEKQLETDADIVTMDAVVLRPMYREHRFLPDCDEGSQLAHLLLQRRIPVNVWGRLIRRNLYIDYQIRVLENVNMSEDLNVMPRLAYWANRVASVHEELYFYDCQNENSYTFSYTQTKWLQLWKTMGVLENFFSSKGQIYCESLKYGVAKSLIMEMIAVLKDGRFKSRYYELYDECLRCEKKFFCYVDKPSRIILFIKNFTLARFYVKTASMAKRFLKRTKQ